MIILADNIIEKLIQLESNIHYTEPPPPERQPFVSISRKSPIILSAPHGAITFRKNNSEIWHQEDEYTASIALLVSEVCQTSVIATSWRTCDSDPNESDEEKSNYKKEL